MNEVYFVWSKGVKGREGSEGGVIRLRFIGFNFIFEKVSGSSIPTEALIGLMWNHPALKDFRDTAALCKRTDSWSVKRFDGMSGCSSWHIQYLRNGRVCTSNCILHSSMNGKQNENIQCYIRDFFDVLWELKKTGCYPDQFDPNEIDEYGYVDITEKVLSERKEFRKTAHGPDEGFGCKEEVYPFPVVDPQSDDEPTVDYSNYTPTEEKEEIVEDKRPIVPVSTSKEDDEDEYI